MFGPETLNIPPALQLLLWAVAMGCSYCTIMQPTTKLVANAGLISFSLLFRAGFLMTPGIHGLQSWLPPPTTGWDSMAARRVSLLLAHQLVCSQNCLLLKGALLGLQGS